jgi:hypothetical protein
MGMSEANEAGGVAGRGRDWLLLPIPPSLGAASPCLKAVSTDASESTELQRELELELELELSESTMYE